MLFRSITAEEHQAAGGMGSAVAEKLRTAFPELEVLVSEDARDPYTYL